jgi:hypothetical protein
MLYRSLAIGSMVLSIIFFPCSTQVIAENANINKTRPITHHQPNSRTSPELDLPDKKSGSLIWIGLGAAALIGGIVAIAGGGGGSGGDDDDGDTTGGYEVSW